MSESNKRILILSLLSLICITLCLPFINGLGCNANLIIKEPSLGTLYGRCEYGRLTFTVKHHVTRDIYEARGFLGYWDKRYFVIISQRNIVRTDNSNNALLHQTFYYRTFYSGMLFGEKLNYALSAPPRHVIHQIDLRGKLGFIH